MKAIFLILLFAVTVVFLGACKKETTVNTPVNNPVYLTRVVDSLFLPNYPEYASTTNINYHYDSLNRLLSVVFLQSEIIIPEIYSDSTVYYYNGSDTLPFKAICTDLAIGPVGTILEYFTYDAQGRISAFLSMPLASGMVAKDEYSYTSNQIIIKHFGDTSVPSASFDTLLFDGNNITRDIVTDTTTGHASRTIFDIQSSTVQNPFNLVSINRHKPYRPSYSGHHSIFEPGSGIGQTLFSRNAVSAIAVNGQTGVNYEYDVVDGLPGKVLITERSPYSHSMNFYYR